MTGILVPRPGVEPDDSAVIRIIVIARSRLHREGLQRVLDTHPRLDVVGSAALTHDALGIVRRERPDVALLELTGLQDIVVTRYVTERSAPTKIIGIAESISEATLIAALEAGMVAVVGPDAGVHDLVATFDAVQRGEFPCSPRTAAILQRRLHDLAQGRAQLTEVRLTPRERDIMILVDEGLSNAEIARRLFVEVSTVKNHLHNIFEKLDVHTRTEALSLLAEFQAAPHDGSRSFSSGSRSFSGEVRSSIHFASE
jgi:two-component system, NarL family, nitrate/nitrite response regulator NarL